VSNLPTPGDWPAYVLEAYLGKSAKKGTPELRILFQCSDEHGPKVWAYRYFTDGTAEYLVKELKAMGWDPAEHDYDFDQLETVRDPETNAIVRDSALCGTWVSIVVKEEEYEGKTQTKVAFINSATVREEMPAEERKTFLADLRKRMIAVGGAPKKAKQPNGKKPPPSPAAQAQKERVKQAVEDHSEKHGGSTPPPADDDWDDIRF